MSKYIIGVDIGGTKIASGIITKQGKLEKKIVLPTFADKGALVSLNQVYFAISELLKLAKISIREIEGIGVCAPGPLDPVKGIVYNPPNLPGWKYIPLTRLIKDKFKTEIKLENDANAAGLAEMIWGSAMGYKHIFYVTVSTGIGTAIIVDGRIYHGKNGMAGEGGHVTIDYNKGARVCNCGNIGCIEAMASGVSTIKQLVKKLQNNSAIKTIVRDMVQGNLNNLTMKDLGKAAKLGDKIAMEAISDEARFLGIWLGSMISVLDPEIIVIGGGVSFLGKFLFDEIRKTIPAHTINLFADKTPVVQAKLKKNVGIFGAAAIMM